MATVIDCHSRRVAGWAVADHMRTSLVEDALHAASRTRGSLAGAIFHSDHGSVYTSQDYASLCAELGVVQSMGAVGSSRQRARGIVQRHRETRDPPRRGLLARRDRLPPRGVPVARHVPL